MAKRSGPVEVIAVDAEIDRLYQLSLDEFTGARNALAARVRAAGHAEVAGRVRTLAKPGLPSWAVNQVYWRARDVFDGLLRAGDRLRDAQLAGLQGTAADVAQAALSRQQAIDAVVERAMRFVTDAGSPSSSTTQQRVAVTADALAAYGTLPNRPPAGRLSGDLDPPGFGLLAALVPAGVLGGHQTAIPGAQGPRDTGGTPPAGAEGQRSRRERALPHEPSRGREPAGTRERAQEPREDAPRPRDEARDRREALDRARFEAARADAELRRRRGDQERASRDLERASAKLAGAEDTERRVNEALAAAQRAAAEARDARAAAASRAHEAAEAAATAEREALEAKQRLQRLAGPRG